MVDAFSKALEKTLSIERILWDFEGKDQGPTMVFFAGIHGNETAGIFAIKEVFKNIRQKDIKGSIIAISGNLKALNNNLRFIDEDLNRIWTKENIATLKNKTALNSEENELLELLKLLDSIIAKNKPPYYFIDLHTTSSKTLPFITINDALINRYFSMQFPTAIVLGIEEYLDGAMLSYINTLGYVAIGFESGQHNETMAIKNAEAFIMLALLFGEVIEDRVYYKKEYYYTWLKAKANNLDRFFEITYLHTVVSDFKMKPNFKSFQPIKKGETLATDNGKDVVATQDAIIFMPLYQKKGKDGFFIIKEITAFFMNLSILLRNYKVDSLLTWLPGVSWADNSKEALKVNLKVTRFFAKAFFHLLGYRSTQADDTHLKLFNRERASKKQWYKNTKWYKNRS